MTTAEYIADQLYKRGIRYVFGIPGGPSLPYIKAFREAGIVFILTSHESSAGIMAEVTARLTGIPGVCHATYGAGAVNIASGVGCAFLDRSSLLVFTSEMNDMMKERTCQMNIDHQALFRPLTKATFRMTKENTREILSEAFSICRKEYPGPVHIGLPDDIADAEVNDPTDIQYDISPVQYDNDISRINLLLENSRRPVLAAGLTAARLSIHKELNTFLESYRMPVVLTPMAKGLIAENHPSYAGVLFHSLSDYLDDILDKADLIIGLGYDPVELTYESWMPDVPLIHFNTIHTDLPHGEDIIQYRGYPGEWFSVLMESLNKGIILFDRSAVNGIREEMLSVFNGFTGHFGPVSVLKILQEELPSDSVITADVGSHLHLAGQFWQTGMQGTFIMTNGWSGMGFGIPAALAASLVIPSATVVTITGDGGFLMTAGELITAQRNNLRIIVVVFSDGELNLIRLKQEWSDQKPYGTTLYHGDIFGSDIFLGTKVLKADCENTMRKAVTDAISIKESVIINAVIDPDDYRWLIKKQH